MKPRAQWRVLVIGLGQIGGSMALAIGDRRLVSEVVGYDIDQATIATALERQVVDSRLPDLDSNLRRFDLVIIATPIRSVIPVIQLIKPFLATETIVLDVAGTKAEITEAAAKLSIPNFIGGHPMAGTERSGLEAARGDLFEAATFVLCPPDSADREATAALADFISRIGARPLILKPDQHDRLVALTSHLPYALSLALATVAGTAQSRDDQIARLLAGSFRDATRVAASDADLTVDMFLTNRSRLDTVLEGMIAQLQLLRTILDRADGKELRDYVLDAQQALSGLTKNDRDS